MQEMTSLPGCSEPLLRTRQVAEALGVSVSTIKRWVDSGALRATRTVGKHRLVPLEEAIQFAKRQDLSPVRLEAMLEGNAAAVVTVDEAFREALVEALCRGRLADVKSSIAAAYANSRGASQLADDLIRPVMERIGHGWSEGLVDVYEEHRATRIVEMALIALIGKVTTAPGAPLAMGATPEGDPYTLSGLLGELALRELGWDVMNLGPSLPMASLARAVRDRRPKLVWISINFLTDPERFVREYEGFFDAASSAGAAVYLGGPALDRPLRARLVAAGFGERIAHLAEFARRLCPTGRPGTDSRPSEATERKD